MLCKLTHCAGRTLANTRPHQLCWGNWEMGTAISFTECTQVAGLIQRSVEAPQKHTCFMIHHDWYMNHECSIPCIYHACSMLRMFYASFMHTCPMHETWRNTCILCTVYIEIFSVDTFLRISLVSHSQIKNHKHMSFLHVSTWQAHCTVAYHENKILCSKLLWAFVKYYCEICCSVVWYSTYRTAGQGR